MAAAGLTASVFPFVAQLSERGRRELGALPTRQVARRHRLLSRGDPVGGAYFITDGRLRVYYVSADGREATLYNVASGQTCILALTASFADGLYPAWVDAGPAGARFVRVPRLAFRHLFEAEPALRDFVFEALSGRVLDLMRTLEETGSVRVEQRVARHLIRHADAAGVVRQSQGGIAAELGTAREVVFRALQTFVRRGLIEKSRARIGIIRHTELSEVALESKPRA